MSTVPFQPSQISNCILWFDAADSSTFLLSGAQVTRWSNKGTLNVFASNVAVSPYTAGANPPGTVSTSNVFSGGTSNVLRFPPSSGFNGSYLGVSNVVTTQKSRTWAYIFSISNTGLDNYFRVLTSSDKATATKQVGFGAWNRDGNGLINWPTGYDATEQLTLGGQGDFAGTLTNSVPFFVVFRHSTTLANNYVSVNGTQITAPAANQALVNGYFTGSDNFAVGVGTGYSSTLLLGEVMQYDGEITTTQIRQIEGYLAWKWGRTAQLPATHPYKNFAPTGTTTLPLIQLNMINAIPNPGTITLPSSFAIAGRTLTFKDWYGAFSTNAMTLTVNNSNQTIDAATTFSLVNQTRLGWQTLIAGNLNRWYTVGGTVINTVNTSSIATIGLSSVSMSTGDISVSTIGFIDQINRSTTQLYTTSTFLYYLTGRESTIISGTRQSFGGLFLRTRGLFQPNQISGLQLWLDAANSNTVVGNPNVTQWRDLSPTNKTVRLPPIFSVSPTNQGTGINFLNTTSGLSVTNMPTTPYDFFVVGSPLLNNTGFRTFLRTELSPGVHPLLTNTGTNNVGMWNGASFQQFGTYTWVGGELAMFFVRATTTTAVVCQASKNGDINLTAATTPNTTDSQITRIGNASSGGGQNCGIINEIILYNVSLTTPQRQQVEGYLAWKWGLVGSLPSAHPFKNTPP